MDRSSRGHGAEPISIETAAARQREADRLGTRTGIFVMFKVVALPRGRGDSCKLTIPEINETWDNEIGSVMGVRYHLKWSLDYSEPAPDTVIKPDPAWGDDAGVLLGIWDIGTEGTRIDIKSIPQSVRLSVYPQSVCFPNTPNTKSAKRAAAGKRVKKFKELREATGLEDGLD